jgi:hypothetical protein
VSRAAVQKQQQKATNAMLVYDWRLIGPNGETRRQEKLTLPSPLSVWKALQEIAEYFGCPGEVLQVFDEAGDMVIRMGVATARSMTTGHLRAA